MREVKQIVHIFTLFALILDWGGSGESREDTWEAG